MTMQLREKLLEIHNIGKKAATVVAAASVDADEKEVKTKAKTKH